MLMPSRLVVTGCRSVDALTAVLSVAVGAALSITFVKVTAALNWYPAPLGRARLVKFPVSPANSMGVKLSVVAGA